jgi:tetratricopeptide (TPR) repeat protein
MHVEACEATRVRGHQSDEVLGLRMACLDRDLKQLKALTALFLEADEQIVQNAAQAANGLPDLRACADVDALLAPLKAPSDSKAQQVINQVRGNLARAQALLDSGRYAQSAEIAAKAASDAKELRFAPLQAEALLLEGNAQVEAGQYKDAAAKLFSAALAAEAGHHKQVEARAYLRLVRVVGSLQWRIEEAKIFSSLAEATIAQAGESTELSGELEEARGELAYYGQGRPEEAFGHVDRALTLLKKALGSEHPRVIWMHNFVGWIHADLGHLDEALAHMQEALAIRERNLGPRHPEVGKGLFNLALVRLARGETDEALALHLRALELWTQALGPDHPLVLRALAGIAEVKAEQGHDLEAEQALASLIPRMTQVMGRENPRLVEALITRGEALLRLGRADEAEQLLQQALDGEIKASGPDHPWQSAPMVGLAEVALVKKDPARAIDLAEHAISLLGEGSRRDLGAARFALARALDEKGRHDEATKAGIQARDDLRLTAPRSRKLRDLEAWLSKKGTP